MGNSDSIIAPELLIFTARAHICRVLTTIFSQHRTGTRSQDLEEAFRMMAIAAI